MSSNSSLNLTSLDFDVLRENFRTYMKSQSTFKDYNFDGSNISVLLDVMAYNTFLNSFYLNMVASEMFLDSAQKFDSVVSHAKELNYVPQSSKSAQAVINFTADCTNTTKTFLIPKGTVFNGTNANGSYSFTTDQLYTFTSVNSTFSVANVYVYEGIYFNDTFIVDYNIEDQKYLLSNKNVDTTSLTITVYDTNDTDGTVYTKAESLFGLTGQSNIYFIQAAHNGQYEVVFGDNYFGRKPKNATKVTANYRVSNGDKADGVFSFTLGTDLGIQNGNVVTQVSAITVTSNSFGGTSQESMARIKYNAPRYFATQYRAVSNDDYAAIIKANFGGEISDVAVYGGQDLEPKLYGRVALCIKPTGTTLIPTFLKNRIVSLMQDYIALPNRVIITEPDYFYIQVKSTVQFNRVISNLYLGEMKSIVTNRIIAFSKEELELFGNDFRYSRLVAYIDNSDESVTSNDTEVNMVKRLYPKVNTATPFTINFNNTPDVDNYTSVLSSTKFTFIDNNANQYTSCFLKEDLKGKVIVYTYINNVEVILDSDAGTINYTTGKVYLKGLKTAAYDNYISLYLRPKNKDIIATQNMILLIESADVSVTAIETVK